MTLLLKDKLNNKKMIRGENDMKYILLWTYSFKIWLYLSISFLFIKTELENRTVWRKDDRNEISIYRYKLFVLTCTWRRASQLHIGVLVNHPQCWSTPTGICESYSLYPCHLYWHSMRLCCILAQWFVEKWTAATVTSAPTPTPTPKPASRTSNNSRQSKCSLI